MKRSLFSFRVVSLFLVGVGGVFSLSGCGEQVFLRLSSPAKTMESYLASSRILLNEVQLKSYLLALGCFSQEDREWFDSHYAALPFNHEDEAYKMANLSLKKAFAFGEIVVPAGPQTENPIIYVRKQTEDSAVVAIDGLPGEYHLVKEGPNWRIKGLFGIERDSGVQNR